MYKKIDVLLNGKYMYSTNVFKTCKEAKARFLELNKAVKANEVKAYFDHSRR
jgi:hypothetical protein